MGCSRKHPRVSWNFCRGLNTVLILFSLKSREGDLNQLNLLLCKIPPKPSRCPKTVGTVTRDRSLSAAKRPQLILSSVVLLSVFIVRSDFFRSRLAVEVFNWLRLSAVRITEAVHYPINTVNIRCHFLRTFFSLELWQLRFFYDGVFFARQHFCCSRS